jgi:hypothetical protein
MEFNSESHFPIVDYAKLTELIARHGKARILRVINEAFPDSVSSLVPRYKSSYPLPSIAASTDVRVMTLHNEKVTDILKVLGRIRELLRNNGSLELSRARQYAVEEVAESELKDGRFKDSQSARNTIFDACSRRLRPEIVGIRAFDEAVADWLREGSGRLKEILLKQSDETGRYSEVTSFFETSACPKL